nr:HprK-related kinase A [Methylomonas sp. SURF-2]
MAHGLVICTGPFNFLIRSSLANVGYNLERLYQDFPVDLYGENSFCDFHVNLRAPRLIRSLIHPQAQFYVDDRVVFNPFPMIHATAMLEWGMNWCISTQIHTYLIIHAAVMEKNGFAAVLPAPPGSGKSTLCASLVQEGWRLLSDELTLINLITAGVVPVPRPIGLKNRSIDIIRQRYPQAVLGVLSSDTLKGSVCHLKPPTESVQKQFVECPIGWIIFPKYEAGAITELLSKPKGQAFMEVANNAFNYSALGVKGFEVLKQVVDRADCFSFKYSNLDEAIVVFSQLEPPHEN